MLPAVQFRMLNVPKHMQRVRNPAIKHPDEHTFFLDFHLCEDPTAMIADALCGRSMFLHSPIESQYSPPDA